MMAILTAIVRKGMPDDNGTASCRLRQPELREGVVHMVDLQLLQYGPRQSSPDLISVPDFRLASLRELKPPSNLPTPLPLSHPAWSEAFRGVPHIVRIKIPA